MILGQRAFAHRGLWAPGEAPENSIAAFRAAAEAGLGIELDVQLSKDGVPVVFHDPALERLTDGHGLVWEHTVDELTGLALAGSDERIPKLSEVVRTLPAGTPVLIELKASPFDAGYYLRAVDLALFAAPVEAAVMSFIAALNREARASFAGRPRGALVPALHDADPAERFNSAGTCAPDYFAVWHADVSVARAHLGPDKPLAAWTVDSREALAAAKAAGAAVIFEHLPPALALGDRSP